MSVSEQRRQTPTERLHEVTLAALQRVPSSDFEKELTLNAKGDVQIRIAGKSNDPDNLAWVEQEFDRFREKYPRLTAPAPNDEPKPVTQRDVIAASKAMKTRAS